MAAEEEQDVVITEEMLKAMRWASNLDHDPSLSSLIRSLLADIVAEQVAAYRERDKPQKMMRLLNRRSSLRRFVPINKGCASACGSTGIADRLAWSPT